MISAVRAASSTAVLSWFISFASPYEVPRAACVRAGHRVYSAALYHRADRISTSFWRFPLGTSVLLLFVPAGRRQSAAPPLTVDSADDLVAEQGDHRGVVDPEHETDERSQGTVDGPKVGEMGQVPGIA